MKVSTNVMFLTGLGIWTVGWEKGGRRHRLAKSKATYDKGLRHQDFVESDFLLGGYSIVVPTIFVIVLFSTIIDL